MTESKQSAPPPLSPSLFPALLAGFSLWSFWDGFLSSNPEGLHQQLFNRFVSGVFLLWALLDFLRTRRGAKKETAANSPKRATG